MCDKEIKVVLENGMELRLCSCPNSRVAFGPETKGQPVGSLTEKVREAISKGTFPLGCCVLQRGEYIRVLPVDETYKSRPSQGRFEESPLLVKENTFYDWKPLEIKEIDWGQSRKAGVGLRPST